MPRYDTKVHSNGIVVLKSEARKDLGKEVTVMYCGRAVLIVPKDATFEEIRNSVDLILKELEVVLWKK